MRAWTVDQDRPLASSVCRRLFLLKLEVFDSIPSVAKYGNRTNLTSYDSTLDGHDEKRTRSVAFAVALRRSRAGLVARRI